MKTLNLFVRPIARFAAAFAMIGAWGVAAHAETLTVHVPFAFEASGKSLPAGDYTFESVAIGLLVMRGATAADTVAIVASPSGYTDAANPSVSFASGTEIAVLSRIRMDGGMTFAVRSLRPLPSAAVPVKSPVALSHN